MSDTFDYSQFPVGYYDRILHEGSPVRRSWHQQKFERVRECLPPGHGLSVLDIGCFAGSFLSLVPTDRFARQLGVDILPEQIDYAQARYGNAHREFRVLADLQGLAAIEESFDCITLIEVIEHLTAAEAAVLLGHCTRLLKPGGRLVLSTPNYTSAWPLVEWAINRFADVSYEDQHILKFHWFNVRRKLARLRPSVWSDFRLVFQTTTHFVTPFLAFLHFKGAQRLSRLFPHAKWHFPFGNLLLLSLEKTPR